MPQFANLGEQPVKFLSTPSVRRATVADYFGIPTGVISIHALREEGDYIDADRFHSITYFYPRPP